MLYEKATGKKPTIELVNKIPEKIEKLKLLNDTELEDIINVLKDSMSARIFELLKRGDESYVVFSAHKNARFVEDCVREMAKQVVQKFSYLPGDSVITIQQTNEESIHQHDAYAERKATIAELKAEIGNWE